MDSASACLRTNTGARNFLLRHHLQLSFPLCLSQHRFRYTEAYFGAGQDLGLFHFVIWITAKIKNSWLTIRMKRLDEIRLPQGRKRVIYEHTWRSDFVGEALTIEFENDQEVVSLEFYSSDHGIVRWVRRIGFLPSHSWECDKSAHGNLHGNTIPQRSSTAPSPSTIPFTLSIKYLNTNAFLI